MTTTFLTWFCAIGCGVMAGVYFTFSAFAMTAFGALDPRQGMAAMNAINAVIVRSPFLPLFFGTSAASAVLILIALVDWTPDTTLLVTAGLAYVAGMFGITLLCNVPLNNELAGAGGASADGALEVWARYRKRWTRWNHLRTAASTLAAALYMAAL